MVNKIQMWVCLFIMRGVVNIIQMWVCLFRRGCGQYNTNVGVSVYEGCGQYNTNVGASIIKRAD